MKLLFLITSSLIFSSAYADSVGVLNCGTDKDISVEISRYSGQRPLLAQITEYSANADEAYSSYKVRKVKSNNSYKSKNFELILTTGPSDKVTGTLKAVAEDGHAVNATLDCEVY